MLLFFLGGRVGVHELGLPYRICLSLYVLLKFGGFKKKQLVGYGLLWVPISAGCLSQESCIDWSVAYTKLPSLSHPEALKQSWGIFATITFDHLQQGSASRIFKYQTLMRSTLVEYKNT